MKEIDKTKQNIRVNDIDESQRKDLFNRFKDAGGKVISERDSRRALIIDREKQKQHQQKLDQHYGNKRIPAAGRIVSQKRISSVVYGAIVHAYASENCARMAAMESATRSADKMIEKLTQQYHAVRQLTITNELADIIGAANAANASRSADAAYYPEEKDE